MKYFVIAETFESGVMNLPKVQKCISMRQALNLVEEYIDDLRYKYQGDKEAIYVRSTYSRSAYWNTESWYNKSSYGFIVQTYENPFKFTCWNRERRVGFFTNSWVDVKLCTLNVVTFNPVKLNTHEDGFCRYPLLTLDPLPFITELKEKIEPWEGSSPEV